MIGDVYTWRAGEGERRLKREEARSLEFKGIDVFISHKQEDATLAKRVGGILFEEGLHSYLDVWDPNITDALELEEYIRSVIRRADVLLAVITEKTKLSWWVPFEIGAARESKSQIASYVRLGGTRRSLPSYMRSWPRMASERELRGWAQAFVQARRHESPEVITTCMRTLSHKYELGDFSSLEETGGVTFDLGNL